jgi:hypothetical protein
LTAEPITPTRHAKGVIGDAAQGQVFELKKLAVDGSPVMGVPVPDGRSGFEAVAAARLLLRA